MNDEESDAKTMFNRALAGDDGGDGPDMGAILARGKRRKLRRTLTIAGSCAAMAAVTVGLGLTQSLTTSAHNGTPELAGQASTPALPPHDLSKRNSEAVQAQLLAALTAHLPAGVKIAPGSGPTSFHLTHPDGTVTTLSAQVGRQSLAELSNPCTGSRYTSRCQPVSLPDGSRGWASMTNNGVGPGGVMSVTAVTLEGKVFGLDDGNTEALSAGARPTTVNGTPLTEQQLIALVEQPDVLAALKKAPTDEPTPVPAGVPHRA
ncbi:hypothetical protein [Streptomyces sp. YGL11-2]|uniref:hypothetical protein n=1 Tax=Streptomyces sp. YGL11-2 TaxID=3414028 RepID=UPI003CF58B81